MLHIKTIAEGNIPEFDKKVNTAIADGWRLTKRDCLLISRDHVPVLLAELEKDIITDDERSCENCKHRMLSGKLEPCLSCSDTCSEWEAQE